MRVGRYRPFSCGEAKVLTPKKQVERVGSLLRDDFRGGVSMQRSLSRNR